VTDGGAGGFDGVVCPGAQPPFAAEVDALLADSAAAGAEISQPARETF